MDEQRDMSYDVTCDISKEDCENVPGTLCEAVARVDSFDGAFDGDFPSRHRRLQAKPGPWEMFLIAHLALGNHYC